MSHYKINERKCSTTFFPFDFIFLFHTAGGGGAEASPENSQPHSRPWGSFSSHRGRELRLPQISEPRPCCPAEARR